MSLRIAICVQNKTYADRLKKYWDKNYRDKLEVSVFSDFEYMAEYLKKYSADFVLLEELWKEKVESLEECPPYALLTKQTSVYKGYKQDKIEMRGDRAEMSDFPRDRFKFCVNVKN